MTAKAYGAHAADKPLEALDIVRRTPGEHDVQIEIAYCGVCHSDLHTVRGEWTGITTWSPLKHWNAGPGKKVGVVGIGGLGHMGVKLARALGAEVVAFTTSENKREDARTLGAHDVVVSRNAEEMAAHVGSFDMILNTVAASHDLDAYTRLLKRDGVLVLVGVPEHGHPSPSVYNLVSRRRAIAGSMIGGIAETQEMLDFCAEHGIVADIEMIAIQQIEDAYERMTKSDVKYRFVIDNATLSA